MKRNMQREPGKIPGIYVEFDKKYLMPPLNLAGLEQHDEEIQEAQKDDIQVKVKMDLICRIALTALQRNYPDMTLVFLKNWIDLGNMLEVFQAVMGISGFDEVPVGEAPTSD